MSRTLIVAAACSILTAGLTLTLSQPAGASQPAGGPPPAGPGVNEMGALLVGGLRSVPGCAGVELAQTQGGRNTIMAWFVDKQAAMRWVKHPIHQRLMGMAGVDAAQHQAMQHVPDGVPILVMATITPSDGTNGIDGMPMPISQISIELYTPLAGGAYINGRLTPEGIKVPHMKNYNLPNYGLDADGVPVRDAEVGP